MLCNSLVNDFDIWSKKDDSKPYFSLYWWCILRVKWSWFRDLFSCFVTVYMHLFIKDAFQNVQEWFFSTPSDHGQFINIVKSSHKNREHMAHSLSFSTGRKTYILPLGSCISLEYSMNNHFKETKYMNLGDRFSKNDECYFSCIIM